MYSPRKDISRYFTYREEELSNLRDQLKKKKALTNQDLLTARQHLHKLKNQYNQIASSQQPNNLKNILSTSNKAVSDLLKQKKILLKQLQFRENQLSDLDSIKNDLQKKGSDAQAALQRASDQYSKLTNDKDDKDNQILQKQQQINQLRKIIQHQRQIQSDIQEAQVELRNKTKMAERNLQNTQKMIQNEKQRITKQLQQINNLEHQLNNQQLKMQNLSLKLQNQQKVNQNYQHRYEIAQNRIQKNIQDKYLLVNQSSTQQNIDQLIESCLSQRADKQKQYHECIKDTNKLQQEILKQKTQKKNLDQKNNQKEKELQELKQKNDTIRGMLNEVFCQDSQVIKIIAQKKVFERTSKDYANKQNIKPVNNNIGKIYTKFPLTLTNQSNTLTTYSKGIQNAETAADGFLSRNNSLF